MAAFEECIGLFQGKIERWEYWSAPSMLSPGRQPQRVSMSPLRTVFSYSQMQETKGPLPDGKRVAGRMKRIKGVE